MMIYLAIISVSAVLSVARGSCVNMATQKAMACTSQLDVGIFAGSSPNKTFGHGNFDRLVQACRNGDLLTAIGCLEMAMGECEDSQSDTSIILRQMIDTKKARTSIDFFCTNIRAYNSNIECIEHHHKDQDVCAQDAKTSYAKQASSAGNADALLLFHCSLYQALMECVQRVLQVKCSEEAASIVIAVMEGFEPPFCSVRKTTTTVSVMKTEILPTQSIHKNDDDSSDAARSSSCKSSTHNILIILFGIFILVLC